MASGGPNPILTVRESLPKHIAELEAQLAKKLGEVMEIQQELAIARTLSCVAPPAAPAREA